MSDVRIRTSLQGMQPASPMSDAEIRSKAAKLYHETGTVMLRPEWLRSELDRIHLNSVAEMMFGRRS